MRKKNGGRNYKWEISKKEIIIIKDNQKKINKTFKNWYFDHHPKIFVNISIVAGYGKLEKQNGRLQVFYKRQN